MFTLRDIAKAVVQSDERVACKIQTSKNQIIIKTTTFPDEVAFLLSPYYQDKLKKGTLNKEDIEALLVETQRIIKIGQ